jgi:predicted Fe-Mo cluster-binding NifX family protein
MPVTNKVNCQFFADKLIPKEIKIAIPTKDGKNIATFFRSSPYYKIVHIKNRQIGDVSVIKNSKMKCPFSNASDPSSHICTNKNGIDCFNECQVVIIRKIDHHSWDELGHMGIEVIQTDEKEVNESVHKYIDGVLLDKFNFL